MITDTRERIIDYIEKHKQARVRDLVHTLGLSNVAVHKQLKRLVDQGALQKAGKPPLVFYVPVPPRELDATNIALVSELNTSAKKIVEDNFLHITPDGKLLYGLEGFVYWKKIYQPKKSYSAIIEEYGKAIEEKEKYKTPQGWIDATIKLKSVYKDPKVDQLLFADIYSLPVFGRTKLAKLVLHAKQAESTELAGKICSMVLPLVLKVIEYFEIEAVAYIPPTVPRRVQFTDQLKNELNLQRMHLHLVKVLAGSIPVPQKTLARLEERVINARSTIFIRDIEKFRFRNVLLIDDVAGSGASFHETAKKLRAAGAEGKIIAFAVVGNIKGFDVVRQL